MGKGMDHFEGTINRFMINSLERVTSGADTMTTSLFFHVGSFYAVETIRNLA